MSRPKGSIIGAKPTWTTTATSGIWTLRQAEEMQADGKWPRGPESPTSLAGTANDEQVALTWTAPATTHGTITDYIVEYTPAAGSPTVVATGSTAASYTLTGLTNDTEYTFRVAGVNHTRGDFSSSVAVTPSVPVTDPDFASVSLLLHMDGSNGSTVFADSSGAPKTVTAIGGASLSTTQSKFGGTSAYFDGDGDRLNIPDSDAFAFGSGDYCVEAWLYVASLNTSGGGAFFSQSNNVADNNNRQYAFRVNSNGLGVYFTSDGTGSTEVEQTFSASVPTGEWFHVAFARSSGVLRAYLNGVQVGSDFSNNVTYYNSTATVCVGSFGNYAQNGYQFLDFTGYIDDLRITKGVARYTANFTPPTAAFPSA